MNFSPFLYFQDSITFYALNDQTYHHFFQNLFNYCYNVLNIFRKQLPNISSVYNLFFNCQMELASDNHASV